MKRLVKKAIMDVNVFENVLSQLSTKGRNVLKIIEDYKFTIEQTTRLIANDQHLAQKIIQKKKVLDQAAGLIYSVVFDIENINITQEYNDQQEEVENGPENLPINNENGETEEILEAPENNKKDIPETSEKGIPEKDIDKNPEENNEEKQKELEEKPIDKREKTKEPEEKAKEKSEEKPINKKEKPKEKAPEKKLKTKKDEGEEIED